MKCLTVGCLVVFAGCSTDPAGRTCHLLAGDVVISEIMANPSGDDTGREWFEVYNATHEAVDLAGVTVVASKTDGTALSQLVVDKLTVAANGYAVLGSAAPDLKPAFVTYGYGASLALRNADGLLALKCGTTLVDQATYTTAPDGASIELSGTMAPDALANDDETSWCDATLLYEGSDLGTPGTANERCAGSGPEWMCTEDGQKRLVRQPGVGDLVVSEIMADPVGTDTAEEWFEVYVAADVDLNGLQLGTTVGTPKDTLADASCLAVTAGSYLVFARGTDGGTNGGLGAVYRTESLTLGNTGGTVVLSVGDTVIDQVTYAKAPSGASWSLDPARLDATANDDHASWCAGVTLYGAGGKGSPGAANPACGQ